MSSEKPRRKIQSLEASDAQIEKTARLVEEDLKANPDTFKLPKSRISTEKLTEYFTKATEVSARILPQERRRYAIYCRKSTDTEDKQIRSLSDQVEECLAVARIRGINVRPEDIIQESASAKKSGNREQFSKLIRDFRTGKYQGLISWGPDRVSRNMKEAGEVIELVDEEFIQDLIFCTYDFDNSPNGKMMLGILFATSKQYSDKLSADVKRGNIGNVRDGKYMGIVKKGYYVDEDSHYFMPDHLNWHLMRRAVVMRAYERKTEKEVAAFLNDSHFSQRKLIDDKPKLMKMTNKSVGKMFSDPFYTGVYKHGERIANLNELYNFMPLMTPDEYTVINRTAAEEFSQEYAGHANAAVRLDFGILRGKVICDFCDKPMVFQRVMIKKGKNAGMYMINFHCRNRECDRRLPEALCLEKYGKKKLSKGIRLSHISEAMELVLRNLTKNVVEAHSIYIERLEQDIAIKLAVAKRKLSAANESIKKERQAIAKFTNMHADHLDEYKKYHDGSIEQHQTLLAAYNSDQDLIKGEIARLKASLPTREEFVKLVDSYLLTYLKMHDLVEEDAFYNELVLNLRAGDNSISVINLNPPYDIMVDLEKVALGWG